MGAAAERRGGARSRSGRGRGVVKSERPVGEEKQRREEGEGGREEGRRRRDARVTAKSRTGRRKAGGGDVEDANMAEEKENRGARRRRWKG